MAYLGPKDRLIVLNCGVRNRLLVPFMLQVDRKARRRARAQTIFPFGIRHEEVFEGVVLGPFVEDLLANDFSLVDAAFYESQRGYFVVRHVFVPSVHDDSGKEFRDLREQHLADLREFLGTPLWDRVACARKPYETRRGRPCRTGEETLYVKARGRDAL